MTMSTDSPTPLKAFRLFSLCMLISLMAFSAQAQRLASAPVQGHTTPQSFKLWLMAKKTDKIQLKLSQAGKVINKKTIDISSNAFWHDYAPVTVEFLRLSPQTEYDLEVTMDGKVLEEHYSFTTYATGVADQYTFQMGSCALYATGIFKLAWWNKTHIFKTMANNPADFMLWMGDNVYLLFGDWETSKKMQRKFTKVRLSKNINRLVTSKPQYATWDDHDYGPNNSDGTFVNKDATLANFQSFWPNPSFGTDETPGVFSNFTHNDSEIFLLDDRYHRKSKDFEENLGQGQLTWLKEQLLASTATFKFIVHGSQVINSLNIHECYAMYAERQELFDFIRDNKIEGIVFFSGDRHFSELLKLKEEGIYPFYEFTCSPMASFIRKATGKEDDREFANPLRVPGTLVVKRNYGTVEISGPLDDRVCTLRTFDKNGNMFWEEAIRAQELTFPASN